MKSYIREWLSILLPGLFGLLAYAAACQLEGRFFPVATRYVILHEIIAGDDLVIDVDFYKERDCVFANLDWYVYLPDGSAERFVIIGGTPRFSRPTGHVRVRWILAGAARYKGAPMQPITQHLCHGTLLWNTTTINTVTRDVTDRDRQG